MLSQYIKLNDYELARLTWCGTGVGQLLRVRRCIVACHLTDPIPSATKFSRILTDVT